MALQKKNKEKSAKKLNQPEQKVGFARLKTGIAGLDTILNGGFLTGGTYLILGSPGAGKTILANQLSFHESQEGRRAVYVTLLAENHGRMFGHLDSMDFFDRKRISESIQYVSGYNVLEKDGLEGLMRLLGALVQRHKSSVLFIDGVASAEELSGTSINFKKFVHNLNIVLGISGCTTFLLSSVKGDPARPEYTMVDGIVSLTAEEVGMRMIREIEVTKFRGSTHLTGKHYFEISNHGITVYPRFSAVYGLEPKGMANIDSRLKTGSKAFDQILVGGIVSGSMTSLLGPAGVGKTTFGVRSLAEGARAGEKCMLLEFYEDPEHLIPKHQRLGDNIELYRKNGTLLVSYLLPTEYQIDKLLYGVLNKIQSENVKRLFIDGLGGMKQAGVVGSERLQDCFKALTRELRNLGTTTIMTEETDAESGGFGTLLSYDSALTDAIIEFRHVQIDDRRTQIINVVKNRFAPLDGGFYEVAHAKRGPEVGKAVRFSNSFLPKVEYSDDQLGSKSNRK